MCYSFPALLLLALSALSAFADHVNIDCGSSRNYKDGNDIEWVGDSDYTQSGKPMTVMSNSLSDELVMNTLQVFSTGKKNCYSIPSLSQQQVLVRASFYYGNYDNKSSPPTFDLLLGSNPWDTVVTFTNRTVRYEAIYVLKESSINVCVAQTSDNLIPFMSALEIRSMSTDMYQYFDPDTALFTRDRSFFSDTVSSVLDTSGRIWESIDTPSDMIMETSDATFVLGTTAEDNPPVEALRHAASVPKASRRIQIKFRNLPSTNVPVYVNMYFSEVTILDPMIEKRWFDVYMDDQRLTEEPIAPLYGDAYEYTIHNITANSSTSFHLVATAGSTLPPLINAFEVFIVSDALVRKDSEDGTTTAPSVTTSSGTKKNKKSLLPVILGTTSIPSFAVLGAIIGFLVRRNHNRKSAAVAPISDMGGGSKGTPIDGKGNKDNIVQMGVNHSGEAVVSEFLGNDKSTAVYEYNAYKQ